MASGGALVRVTQLGRAVTRQAVAPPDEGASLDPAKSLMDLLLGTTLAKPAGRPAVIVEWRLDDSERLSAHLHKKLVQGSKAQRVKNRQHNQRRQQQNIAGDSRKRLVKLSPM